MPPHPHPRHHTAPSVGEVVSGAQDSLEALVEQVKPHLRGWLHLGMVPLSLAAGIVLVALSTSPAARASTAVFALTGLLLFTTSALYHRGRWAPRTATVLKRWDHANIFLIIAGTHTPFAVLLLEGSQRSTLLWVIWCSAVAGVAFRVLWVSAPRWLYIVVYIALGWIAVFYLPAFWQAGGAAVVLLLAAGGLLYTLGAVVYGLKAPDPSPRWFGYHEIFHAFTVAAFGAHWSAALIMVLTAPTG